MDEEIDWDEIGEIISSNYRVSVLSALADGPSTPTQIAETTGKAPPHISRALQHLRDQGMVELLVAEDRKKGRLYGLTDDGREIWRVIQKEGLATT